MQYQLSTCIRCLSALVLAGLILVVSGCSFNKTKRDYEAGADLGLIAGTVVSEEGTEGVLVVLFAEDDDGVKVVGIDPLTETKDIWTFSSDSKHRYYVAAFLDRNGNRIRDAGEPAAWVGDQKEIRLVAREQRLGFQLELSENKTIPSRFLLDVSDETLPNLAGFKIAMGEIADLDEERFSVESAELATYQPLTALREKGGGIYFLGEYDPDKIPILFVHGISGTPRDLRVLIESVDRERFQPWFYYYPSGFRLYTVATGLTRRMTSLHEQLGFERFYLVAHSMGGLVSRSFVHQMERNPATQGLIQLFVTFATPIEGHAAAAWGLKVTSYPVPAWIDMSPGSDFLKENNRPLPEGIPYYLMFGHSRGSGLGRFMPYSSDSVVAVASEIPIWAQKEAVRIRGYDLDHMEILAEPEPVSEFLRILDEVSSGR